MREIKKLPSHYIDRDRDIFLVGNKYISTPVAVVMNTVQRLIIADQ